MTGSTASWLVGQLDGPTMAIIVNSLPTDYAAFFGDVVSELQGAAADVATWPTTDLWA